MQFPLISVIIPTYKPKDYFKVCLASLQSQTLDKSLFEVIIILNGCNEPWLTEIKVLIGDYLPDLSINLIHTDTPGVSNARNIGIDNAKGEYITFIDDDDYVSPAYLECMMNVTDPDAVVLTDSRAFVDGKNGYKENYTPHQCYERCVKNNNQNLLNARSIFNGPCMKLLPLSLIRNVRFDRDVAIGEDSLFMFQISRNIKRLRYTSTDAVYYRRYREGSATTNTHATAYWIKNGVLLQNKYLSSWMQYPFSYNFIFFINRLFANLKGVWWHINNEHLSK